MDVPINRENILKVIPQGENFCFLTEVIHLDKNSARGFYLVSEKDCFSHFGIFPGVLSKEAIAQLGVFLLRSQDDFSDYVPVFKGIYSGENGAMALPGDKLELEIRFVNFDGKKLGQAEGKATINGRLVHAIKFEFTIIAGKTLEKIISMQQKKRE